MPLPRFMGLVDLGVATVVLVMVVLPPREMYASAAIKGDADREFAVALAEARTQSRPDDGLAVEAFSRKLGEAGMKDWAIEAATRSSERAMTSPTRWRALLAASVAFVDRLDVIPGLDYANRALSACESAQEHGNAAACPNWEQIRMRLYQQHLDAGVKSGIDPRRNPLGFRKAGEAALRQIHLGERTGERPVHNDASGGSNAGSGAGSAAP